MKKYLFLSQLLSVLILVGVISLSGCTKQRPYKEVNKDATYAKSLISQAENYLYVPSVLESSRTTSASTPNFMGEGKLVTFRFTEKTLDVLEAEIDSRYQDNATNYLPVLSIPIEHKEFNCKENSVGECSNEEEENTRLSWDQKTKFKPDFVGMKVNEVNTLPVDIRNLFSPLGSCFKEVGAKLLEVSIQKDAVNIQVERTFSTSVVCADESLDSLSKLGFSVVYHYSFVKQSAAVSPNYVPVVYPAKDQGTFGFFTTETRSLSEDNRDRVENSVTYLNRWNPAKKEIVYYLTENFKKPENAAVRAATEGGFRTLNEGLRKAGTDFQLVLKDAEGRMPGDLRYNFIVMVEDPTESRLLGYGPTATNPATGEIINGRVVMFLGVIKTTIRSTYEELRTKKEILIESNRKGMVSKSLLLAKTELQSGAVRAVDQRGGGIFGNGSDIVSLVERVTQASPHEGQANEVVRSTLLPKFDKIERLVKQYTRYAPEEPSMREKVKLASRHCMIEADDVDFAELVKKGMKHELEDPGKSLTPWEDLSEKERAKILDVLVPYVWVPTLVHEMGHNLGLRHNFQGSEDKDNYYSASELSEMGVDHVVPYSSIMDYAARTMNELHTLGKYDIAALRFGYLRQVQNKTGEMVPVASNLKDLNGAVELKEFGYCTDEHVDLNAGCKRFDEGTTLKEIAQFQIKNYEERYQWLNFRNGARSFSTGADLAYAERIDGIFNNLRLFLEVYERIKARYAIPEEAWTTVPFLTDLDAAVELTRDFFLKVIATPDVLCVVQSKSRPGASAEIVPLSVISGEALSCADKEVTDTAEKAGYGVIGQGGKSFLSRKSSSNPNPYADQIDVRGIWMDKLLATKFLLTRKLGVSSLDEGAMSYLDYKDTAERFQKILSGMMLENVESVVDIHVIDGSVVPLKLKYSLDLSQAQMIRTQRKALQKAFDLPGDDTLLATWMIKTMFREVPHITMGQSSSGLLDTFGVAIQNGSINETGKKPLQVGSKRYLARSENQVAQQIFTGIENRRILERIPVERVKQIYDEMKKAEEKKGDSTQPSKDNADEESVRKMGVATVAAFLNGTMLTESRYQLILEQMLYHEKD